MSYEQLRREALNYYPCHYAGSKQVFRGPKKHLVSPYLAFIGSSEIYGKFVPDPFPSLIEQRAGINAVNFGALNAGIDVFLNDHAIMEAASGATVKVLQVMGAHNMSNRYYRVHPRRNDRFLRASKALKAIYSDVDFTEFSFTKHMLTTLKACSAERFELVRDELRAAWLARMRTLCTQLGDGVVLLWVSDVLPVSAADEDQDSEFDHIPLFVNSDMLQALDGVVDGVLTVLPSKRARKEGTAGMIFPEVERAVAEQMLGVQAHQEIAMKLCEKIRDVLVAKRS
ncbi:MAG: DUF6473 family protein [Halocynthiibacter sp.]